MLRSKCAPAAQFAIFWATTIAFLAGFLRDKTHAEDGAKAPAAAFSTEEQVLKALDEKTSLSLEEVPLKDLVQQVRERTKVNVHLDRRALDDVGIADDVPLSVEVRDVSWRSALNLLLRTIDLTWKIENGALVITTQEAAESRLTTEVYNVKDLVAIPGEGGGESDFDSLIQAIHSTVAPPTWDVAGGPASIAVYRETIIVSQTDAVHRMLAELLKALRKARQMAPADPTTAPASTSIRLANATEEAILAALQKPVSLNLEETPLSELPTVLQQTLDVQAVIDARALDDVGLSTDTPLSISVRDMEAAAALSLALQPLDLTWRVADEVLLISSREEAETRLEVRVYPASDLYAPTQAPSEWLPGAGAWRLDDVLEAITGVIDAESWDVVGGAGAIEELPSAQSLVVAQTLHVHRQIEKLLTQLRQRLAESPQRAAEQPLDPDALRLIVYSVPQALPVPNAAATSLGQATTDSAAARTFLPSASDRALFALGQFGGGLGQLGLGPPIPGPDLVEIVTALVEPESWDRKGVYIKDAPGRLIVRQTSGVHRQIETLLVQLGLVSAWQFNGHLGPCGYNPLMGQQ